MNFLAGIKIIEEPDILTIKQRSILPVALSILFICIGIVILVSEDLVGDSLGARIYAAVGILLPLFLILSNRRTTKFITIVFDRKHNTLKVSSRYLLGKESREHALNKVARVELREEYLLAKVGVREAARIFYLILVMENGEEIKLPEFPVFLYNRRRVIFEKTLGEKIAHFLGVPFKEYLRG